MTGLFRYVTIRYMHSADLKIARQALGGIFGEILRVMAPNGAIQNIFASNFSPGINPPLTLDLVLLKLTFGFSIKVSLLSVLGMFLGAYLYKQM